MAGLTINELEQASSVSTNDEIEIQRAGEGVSKKATLGQILSPDASLITGQYKNKIINGDMSVWQRGTSFTDVSTQYVADRWYSPYSNTTVARSSIAGVLHMNITRPLGTSTNATMRQGIELPATGAAGEFQSGSTWTISYEVYLDTAGCKQRIAIGFADDIANTNAVSLVSEDETGSEIATGDWVKITHTFTINASPLASNVCLNVEVGVKKTAGLGASDVNRLRSVQLELGDGATNFEYRHIQQELAMCQRYTHVYSGNYIGFHPPESGQAGTRNVNIQFPVTMRATPTISGLTASGGTGSATNIGARKFRGVITGVAAAGNGAITAFTADAEL